METSYPEFSLFPLGTVLFPGGPLPLRIFEPRYVDMISACLRDDQPFGVCLIRNGREVGEAAAPFETGTFAKIVDWDRSGDGLLTVLALGTARFRVHHTRVQPDQLLIGSCQVLEEPGVAQPADAIDLLNLVDSLLQQLAPHYTQVPVCRDDAAWVGYRLSELMPLPNTRKQRLLELDDPLERLDELRRILRAIELDQEQGSQPSQDP